VFDKALDPLSAGTASNYTLNNGATVTNAVLLADGHTVILGVSPQASGLTYTLAVNGVADTTSPPNILTIGGTASYADTQIPEYTTDRSTIGLWHLNGDGSDASGNGYTLSLNGNASWATNSPVGPTRQCLRVTQLGDYASVTVPGSQITPPAGSPFSIEARIFVNNWKAYSVGNYELISAYQNYNSLFSYNQGIWDYPHVGKFTSGNGTVVMTNSVAQPLIPVNRWVHIALVYDGLGNNYVYVDKVLKAGPIVTSPVGSDSPFTITLGNFDGYIDEVRISKAARNFTFDRSAPSALNANAYGSWQVNLNWADVTNEAGFVVERWAGGAAGFVPIATTKADVLSFVDYDVIAGTNYVYRVKAFNDLGNSEYSPQAVATTPSSSLLGPPPRLVPVGMNPDGSFQLHVNAIGGTPYTLQGSLDGLSWFNLLTMPEGGSTDYTESTAGLYAARFYRTSQ
jgi:hypothetical protein